MNSSSPVRCIDNLDLAGGHRPLARQRRRSSRRSSTQAHEYADACAEAQRRTLLPYLSTDAVVQDLDQIRAALGDEKLTLRRLLVRDAHRVDVRRRVPGPDPRDGPRRRARSRASTRSSFGRARRRRSRASLKRFFAWCSSRRSCAFYEGGQTRQAFDALMAKIEKKPLRIRRYRRSPARSVPG